jgi:hypothetical protein
LAATGAFGDTEVVGDRNTEFLGGSHRLAAVDQKLGVSK